MNLLLFPFHDIRKSLKYGFRNRDGHFIRQLSKHPKVSKVVVVNRPITPAEIVYSKINWKTKGEVIQQSGLSRVVKIHEQLYVLDYMSLQVIRNMIKKKSWFWEAYSNPKFIEFINNSLGRLNVDEYNCLFNNIFSSDSLFHLTPRCAVLDAFDNWLRWPHYHYMEQKITKGYKTYSELCNFWITNSEENKTIFQKIFKVKECHVIKNGVNAELFNRTYEVPKDIENLKKPVIGFGGTITHLFNHELFNRITSDHPEYSFVIIGSIIDKKVFKMIKKVPNLYYLGNKHYNIYPSYIKSFDICIIPYHTKEKAHGGDSIKFYEYLAANKPIVSTDGNGVYKINENVLIAKNAGDFSDKLRLALQMKTTDFKIPEELTWKFKSDLLIRRFQSHMET